MGRVGGHPPATDVRGIAGQMYRVIVDQAIASGIEYVTVNLDSGGNELGGDPLGPPVKWAPEAFTELADHFRPILTNGQDYVGPLIVTATAAWAGNGTGIRVVRIVHVHADTTELCIGQSWAPGIAGVVAQNQQAHGVAWVAAGDSIRMEVYQDTGAALALRGWTPGAGESSTWPLQLVAPAVRMA